MLGGPKDTQLCKTASSTAFTKCVPMHLILVKVYYFISLHVLKSVSLIFWLYVLMWVCNEYYFTLLQLSVLFFLQWKAMFSERFRIRRNWLKGFCNVRTFEGHTQGSVGYIHFCECLFYFPNAMATILQKFVYICGKYIPIGVPAFPERDKARLPAIVFAPTFRCTLYIESQATDALHKVR